MSLKVRVEDSHITNASIVIAGAAGQGIETVAGFLATILKLSGFNVFVTREFMSRIRGGTNSLQIRVSSEVLGSYSLRSDIVIPLTEESIPHLVKYGRINDQTIIIGEKEILDSSGFSSQLLVPIPFQKIANNIGGRIYANTIAAGVVADIFGVSEETAHAFLQKRFSSKGEEVIKNECSSCALPAFFSISERMICSNFGNLKHISISLPLVPMVNEQSSTQTK